MLSNKKSIIEESKQFSYTSATFFFVEEWIHLLILIYFTMSANEEAESVPSVDSALAFDNQLTEAFVNNFQPQAQTFALIAETWPEMWTNLTLLRHIHRSLKMADESANASLTRLGRELNLILRYHYRLSQEPIIRQDSHLQLPGKLFAVLMRWLQMDVTGILSFKIVRKFRQSQLIRRGRATQGTRPTLRQMDTFLDILHSIPEVEIRDSHEARIRRTQGYDYVNRLLSQYRSPFPFAVLHGRIDQAFLQQIRQSSMGNQITVLSYFYNHLVSMMQESVTTFRMQLDDLHNQLQTIPPPYHDLWIPHIVALISDNPQWREFQFRFREDDKPHRDVLGTIHGTRQWLHRLYQELFAPILNRPQPPRPTLLPPGVLRLTNFRLNRIPIRRET